MRHKKVIEKLGRNYSLKKATIRDISRAVFKYQSVITTKAKAKVARKTIERLISMGKEGTLAAKRRAFAILCDHELVRILFSEIAPRNKGRQGGYTRIFALLKRRGDDAQQAVLELTEKIIKEKKIRPEKIKKSEEHVEAVSAPKVAPLPEEKPVSPPEVKSKPKAEVKEKPKKEEKAKPQEEKPKGLLGGLGKLFKRPKGHKKII